MNIEQSIVVVTPCPNEENNVEEFIKRICALDIISEIVFVDDGSQDKTIDKIKFFQKSYANQEIKITFLELTRQFGKESAILAGLDFVNNKYDAVILIDSDLQHPPEKIKEMIVPWMEGFDIVSAVRDDRKSDPFLRGFLAKIFYKIFQQY